MLGSRYQCCIWERKRLRNVSRLIKGFLGFLILTCLCPQHDRNLTTLTRNNQDTYRHVKELCSGGLLQKIPYCMGTSNFPYIIDLFLLLKSGAVLTDALPKVELLEVLLAGNHSLANDYGVSYEPYGMFMESGEPYSEPLLIDAADSGSMHIVYHHCPYTDAILQGWSFQGNQFVTAKPDETPLLLQRRQKMCVARRVEIRSDGEQEGSELTLTAGDQQEPRFFGYRVDRQGYTAYFVAFTRMLPSICVYLKCCLANSNLPCEIVFYDVRNPTILSQFQQVVGAPAVSLSHECPLCLHDGGEDGVPLEYFTSIEEYQLSEDCPNLKPHTYGDSFVFLGPGKGGSRVHKHYAIGSLSNTLQIRKFKKMTQVSVQYPNNLWLSRAGAYHENFYPEEAVRSYYIVRGAEYTTTDETPETLQQVIFYYDSLANAEANRGSEFISGLKTKEVANTKIPNAIFAEHPTANDVTYFYSNSPEGPWTYGGIIVENRTGWRGGNFMAEGMTFSTSWADCSRCLKSGIKHPSMARSHALPFSVCSNSSRFQWLFFPFRW